MRFKLWIKRGAITVTAFMILMATATGCSKKEVPTDNEELLVSPIITPSGKPTIAPTPIAMTPAPGVTITPIPEPTKEPTPTPIVYLTQAEGEAKLKEKIDTSLYTYELTNQEFEIDGMKYFFFEIYENQKVMEPYILVDRIYGDMYVYDKDGNIIPFTKFPIDATEILEPDEYEISVDSALELLKRITKEKLGLPNNLSHYVIIADEWTTVINADVSYCFNVYEASEDGQLVACYYVSTLGTAIYTFDEENGEFIRCD